VHWISGRSKNHQGYHRIRALAEGAATAGVPLNERRAVLKIESVRLAHRRQSKIRPWMPFPDLQEIAANEDL